MNEINKTNLLRRLGQLGLILFLSTALSFLFIEKIIAAGPTPVSGPIVVPTTWTSANSPYVVTDTVTVNAGVILTIEEGTIVKFYNGNVAISVN